MNSVQIHLALTHVPVVLSIVGLIMLAVALILRDRNVTKISYILILVAGITAIPVFLTGEGSEDAIENLPGVSGAFIESHEDVATLAMISVSVAGFFALAALLSFRWIRISHVLRFVVLLLALVSGGLMAQTAHLGGQIRHTEIRDGFVLQENDRPGEQIKEKDDH
jgi:uncharacterized membrane protein